MTFAESHEGLDPRKVVIRKLDSLLQEKFSEEEYHNPHHSAEVDNLSFAICARIKDIDPSLVSEQEELGRETAAKGHDAVVEYVDAITGRQAGQRIRRRGFLPADVPKDLAAEGLGNEQASVKKIMEIINQVDPDHLVFQEKAINEINSAVASTFPTFTFEKPPEEIWENVDSRAKKYFGAEGKGLRIYQPYLFPDSSVATLSIALADLSCAGLMAVEDTVAKGDAEYRETRDKTGYMIRQGISKIPDAQKETMIADMENWLKGQVQFFVWRKAETERIINEHRFKTSPDKEEKIKKVFRESVMFERFNNVITTSINRAERFESDDFKKRSATERLAILAREFGYEF